MRKRENGAFHGQETGWELSGSSPPLVRGEKEMQCFMPACADVHGRPCSAPGLHSCLCCFPVQTPHPGTRLPSRCEGSCSPSSLHPSGRLWHLCCVNKIGAEPFSSAFLSTSTSSLRVLLAVPLLLLRLTDLFSAAFCPC